MPRIDGSIYPGLRPFGFAWSRRGSGPADLGRAFAAICRIGPVGRGTPMMTRRAIIAFALPMTFWVLSCAIDQNKEVALWRQVLNGKKAGPVAEYQPNERLTLGRALTLAN